MAVVEPTTVREQIAWSYANLARAHVALDQESESYTKLHHAIRIRLYRGLISGKMSMRTLYDDERVKMTFPQACYYCGSESHLVVDHLIPRIRGGPDEPDNLIIACKSCNSSKGGKDMLEWMLGRGLFPSILLLRRYLKIVARYCEEAGCLDAALDTAKELGLPFQVDLLPTVFPTLSDLDIWVYPNAEDE